jgi:hypothetical protein
MQSWGRRQQGRYAGWVEGLESRGVMTARSWASVPGDREGERQEWEGVQAGIRHRAVSASLSLFTEVAARQCSSQLWTVYRRE